MNYFMEAFNKAISLMLSFDPELYGIIFLSLKISVIATLISTVIGLPLGAMIGLHRFWGKTALINLINTFMGMPPVVVGLFVYILLSNQIGILGPLRLLFTPTAMIIAQVMLATPIVAGLTIVAVQSVNSLIKKTAVSLGANGFQLVWLIIKEARYAIGAAVITAFGRLTAEVGAVMMVGGNVRFQTRVMTTSIALHKGMGEFQLALALGIILIFISLLINSALDMLRGGRGMAD
ncbi:MAG: ABC transporter permease [Clostridiaceae bacterium]|nr:ABC transporter permease [Clostridiaceae bacterium]